MSLNTQCIIGNAIAVSICDIHSNGKQLYKWSVVEVRPRHLVVTLLGKWITAVLPEVAKHSMNNLQAVVGNACMMAQDVW